MSRGCQPVGIRGARDASCRGRSSGWWRCHALVPVCLAWLFFVILPHAGCSRGRVADARGHGDAVLLEVTRAYVAHLRTHRDRPPADEAEFKNILAQAGGAALQRAGVGTIDELLVSPRDSQPFVIRYGDAARPLLERGVVAYEQTGVSGRRLVGYALGYVGQVDQQAFDALLPAR